ncbi:Lrp/AsnC ligand binding domain-containing protein [Nonomuraea pusilla]|uniref:Lrp/AsnC ligand binding domain-containing protein n=1 Tax=Nonomuraea pusilla TaxID=46177 RepID=UPI00331BA7BC
MPCADGDAVHEVAGEDCYSLKVRVADTDAPANALDHIRAIPSITGTSTTIVLRTVFERPLDVDPARPGDDRIQRRGRGRSRRRWCGPRPGSGSGGRASW